MKNKNTPRTPSDGPVTSPEDLSNLIRRHFRLGWLVLLIFLTLGIVLEGLHAFKAATYLNPSHATRRLMWTLAHVHGTLLGLVNVGFAASMAHLRPARVRASQRASGFLTASTILLPGGFFLGGIGFHGGDPGLGIVLVPAGALALLIGVALVVRQVTAK